MNARWSSTAADLARRGLTNVTTAAGIVDEIETATGCASKIWLDALSYGADPDLALQGLQVIAENDPVLLARLLATRSWCERTCAVLGASQALNQHARAHPGDLLILADEPIRLTTEQIRDQIVDDLGVSGWPEVIEATDAIDRLRLANKRHIMRIAARDLTHGDPASIIDDVSCELSCLADAILQVGLRIARAQVPQWRNVRLGVVALGKCGAQELNYISDVDVLFVADSPSNDPDALQTATKLASALMRICSDVTATGSIWTLDAGLRPEGQHGPLVRTLESHRAYYQAWAENWEFQAMLKARAAAGDLDLAQDFCDMVYPLVWDAGGRPHMMSEVAAMRQRVIDQIPAAKRSSEIKLGPGGLRDVEFSVQVLQLVHGRVDENLRKPGTLQALAALVEHGYIGRADGAQLDQAYRFQRLLEHRIQLYRLQRTHLMPSGRGDQERVARQVGCESADELSTYWSSLTLQVKRLQTRVFFSPLLHAVSELSSDDIRLTRDAAKDRMRALGFADPDAALGHIEALTTGLSRTTAIARQLMPAMLGWLSEGTNPDLGLLEFRRLSDAMGSTSWYMRALRDEGAMAERVARLLSTSRYASDLLRRDPSMVQLLASEDQPRDLAAISESFAQVSERYADDAQARRQGLEMIARREHLRIVTCDVLNYSTFDQITDGLTDLASATIQAGLDSAWHEIADGAMPRLGVVAMGRWGGREMGYSSDCDALFVLPNDADNSERECATRLATAVMKKAELALDADLRPEGRQGPLVRTVSHYVRYYEQWADTWERQALLRAGYGAGDHHVIDAWLAAIDPFRYPSDGLTDSQVTSIRTMKARMERERTTRATAAKNLKLGPGGLSDIEWTVQLWQLKHGGADPALRTPSTLEGLQALADGGYIDAADATTLEKAWRFTSELRNAAMIVRGKASDVLPNDARELASIAVVMGYEPNASELLSRWSSASRRAAGVVEKLLWGKHD